MNGEKAISVFNSVEEFSEAACNFIIALSKRSIEERGRFVIALSGGQTPEKLFVRLAMPSISAQIDWVRTYIFWGDERCVALNDNRNNAKMATDLFLSKIEISRTNIFVIPVNLTPTEAAIQYEKSVLNFFDGNVPRFDLILLGLGTDGHTASLFRGTEVLKEQCSLVKEVYNAEQQMFRVTFTFPLINQARNVLFLVTGGEKSEILKNVLTPSEQPNYPAQAVKPVNGNLHWFIDKAAASKLSAV